MKERAHLEINVVFYNISYFSLNCRLFMGCKWFCFMYGGVEFMHKKKLSEAFMFPACSISKAAIKMQLLLSRTLMVLISSFALKSAYHHLALYIN